MKRPTIPHGAVRHGAVRHGAVTLRVAIGVVPLTVVLALTGCVAGGTDSAQPAPTTPSVGTEAGGAPVPGSGAPGSAAPGTHPEIPHDDATVAPVPEAATGSQAAATEAAEKAVTAFARPDLGYQAWIDGLYPLLSQTGATAYEDTDPVNVPARTVTGAGTVLPNSTEVALIVRVPTDAGDYLVSLSRPSTSAPWLADRIRPEHR